MFVAPGKGTLKTLDEAAQFAKYVHKRRARRPTSATPSWSGTSVDVARRKGEPQNPFPTALPGPNPTLPKKETVCSGRRRTSS